MQTFRQNYSSCADFCTVAEEQFEQSSMHVSTVTRMKKSFDGTQIVDIMLPAETSNQMLKVREK